MMEQLARPVDQDLSGGFRSSVLAGPFDELSVDEGRSGATAGRDRVGREVPRRYFVLHVS